jgi:hypothetical protein
VTVERYPYTRPQPATTEDAVAWLHAWDNGNLIPNGATPVRPWKRASARELAATAEGLMHVRAVYDARGQTRVN